MKDSELQLTIPSRTCPWLSNTLQCDRQTVSEYQTKIQSAQTDVYILHLSAAPFPLSLEKNVLHSSFERSRLILLQHLPDRDTRQQMCSHVL